MEKIVFDSFVITAEGELIEQNDQVLCNVKINNKITVEFLNKQCLIESNILPPTFSSEIDENASMNESAPSISLTASFEAPSTSLTDSALATCTIPSGKAEWDENSSKLLMDLYVQFSEDYPNKQIKSKKDLFTAIAKKINEAIAGHHFTGEQCSSKFKGLKKRKTIQKKLNGQSGNTYNKVDFEEEFDLIGAKDDSFKPELLLGVGKIERLKPTPSTEKKKRTSPAEWALFLHNDREAKKQKRFDEVMKMREEELKKKGERHEELMKLLKESIAKEV